MNIQLENQSMEKQIFSEEQLFDTDPFLPEEKNAAAAAAPAEPGQTAPDPALADLLTRAESGELSVEEAFAALEQIVQRMEEESISLEDSFNFYETGIRLVRYCSGRIDRVEKQVQMLRGEGEAPLEQA